MSYIEWNSAIANYFFNPEKAEQYVYLFADKKTICQIGLRTNNFSEGKAAWTDFLEAIRKGLPNCNQANLLKKALFTFEEWKRNKNSYDDCPLYIAYLTLFVLPLTDSKYKEKRIDAYSPRFRKFAQEYDLPNLGQLNEHQNWNILWKDLENWSFEIKNTDLGLFEDRPFRNRNWIYVGKPLSQCLVSAETIRRLGDFFNTVGLTPGQKIDKDKLGKCLWQNAESLKIGELQKKILKDENDEKRDIILKIVANEFAKWDGNTDIFQSEENLVKKGQTIARVFTFFQLVQGFGDSSISFCYRFYSKNEFPDELKFNHTPVFNQIEGWSNPFCKQFKEEIEWPDHFNKWTLRLPQKEIRIFVSAAKYNLPGWVESDYLTPGQKNFILTKEIEESMLLNWSNCTVPIKKVTVSGLPSEYLLFELDNPSTNHPHLSALQIKTQISVEFTGGFHLGRRKWLDTFRPKIIIDGISNTDKTFIELKYDKKILSLKRHENTDASIFQFPTGLPVNTPFYIKVENRKISGDTFPYEIVDFEKVNFSTHQNLVKKLDEFGNYLKNEPLETVYLEGFSVTNLDYGNQKLYSPDFNLAWLNKVIARKSPSNNKPSFCHNLLLYFLTLKGKANAKDYYQAFNQLGSKIGIENKARAKRASLQMLDYLGFVNYDYENREIIVNPPTLVPIPVKKGRELILTGGRTPELIEKMKDLAAHFNLQITVASQANQEEELLLPDRILVSSLEVSFHQDKRILEFAAECNLQLTDTKNYMIGVFKLPQFGLLEFSANLENYETALTPNPYFGAEGWICRIFKSENNELCFKNAEPAEIDKNFQLVEYKINEYSFLHILWKDGVAYPVNKNWGRYLVLKKQEHQVIFYDDNKNILAVPATVPLPRLLMKAVCLCSGFAPTKEWRIIEQYETYWHFFKNVPSTLFKNSLQTKLNQNIKPFNF